MRFAVFVSNRTTFPQQLVMEAISSVRKALELRGIEAVLPEDPAMAAAADLAAGQKYAAFLKENPCDGVLAIFPNFGDECSCHAALRDAGCPILFVAIADTLDAMGIATRRDSFCGKISAVNLFRQCGTPCSCLAPHTVDLSSEAFAKNLKDFSAICWIVKGMKRLRTGSIGARCTPFKTVRFDETALEKYGISNEAFDLSELFSLIRSLPDNHEEVQEKCEFIRNYTLWPTDTRDVQLRMTKLALGIEKMVTKYQLDLVTLRCWTELEEELKLSPCMVLSMLNDKRITANCEVDTVNAIAMHLLSLAADAPGACLDWNNNYGEDENACVLFHCGPTACSLMQPGTKIVDHPMFARVLGCGNGLGCNEGRMKDGKFTWATGMTRNGNLSILLDRGTFGPEKLPEEFFGCGGIAHFADFQKKLLFLLKKGFPHHMTLSYGDHFRVVEEAVTSYLHYDLITFEK